MNVLLGNFTWFSLKTTKLSPSEAYTLYGTLQPLYSKAFYKVFVTGFAASTYTTSRHAFHHHMTVVHID